MISLLVISRDLHISIPISFISSPWEPLSFYPSRILCFRKVLILVTEICRWEQLQCVFLTCGQLYYFWWFIISVSYVYTLVIDTIAPSRNAITVANWILIIVSALERVNLQQQQWTSQALEKLLNNNSWSSCYYHPILKILDLLWVCLCNLQLL